ncbi:MAG: DICT sensory domain-containing protein [Halobacteriaceae archaeon]
MSGRTLDGVIDSVRARERTVRVYAPAGDPVVTELREYLAAQNVSIDHVVDDGPVRAEVRRGGTVLGTVEGGTLRALAAPDGEVTAVPLLEYLDGTTFTSYDRDQMLHASREIEDRAWRVGRGTLHAGFQDLDAFEAQREAYRELGELSGLAVHVHLPEAPPDAGAVTVHTDGVADIGEKWFVVYDGGGDDEQKSALLAVEGAPGEYYGVWTYDREVVEDALAVLEDAV